MDATRTPGLPTVVTTLSQRHFAARQPHRLSTLVEAGCCGAKPTEAAGQTTRQGCCQSRAGAGAPKAPGEVLGPVWWCAEAGVDDPR